MSGPGTAVVVGGGVIGAACAYYLARSGWRVTVIDRAEFGKGCSHANCGYVSPSHVLPLAVPGAIGDAFRSVFRPDAPLRVKPRIDPALWTWFYHFARRCNPRDVIESARGIRPLLTASRELYDELFRAEPLECEWEPRGMLFVLRTAHGMGHFAETDRLLRGSFGLGARRLDGRELVEFEPALKPGLAGGWYYDTDAHLRPDRLMASWRDVLTANGVEIRDRCEAVGFVAESGRARAVTTAAGEVEAQAVVVAAGALTPRFGAALGCRLPIQPGKGYSVTMPRPARCPTYPLIFEEHRVAVTPMRSGYRIGSTMEFAGYDTSLDRQRLDGLRRGAAHYLHDPTREPVLEEWYGWRPMTYDSRPVIDRSPALRNVVIAAGHNMLGVSMSPATGKLVAQLVCGETPFLDPRPYAVTRF